MAKGSDIPVKVPMTAYVPEDVKAGIRLLATLEHSSISTIVESLCVALLDSRPDIQEIVKKGRV